jgi:phage terminase small subunit
MTGTTPVQQLIDSARQEEFAQCIANGMTSREALTQMGLSHAPNNYLRLAKAPGMVERVRTLVAQRLQAAGVTAERTKREIARVAYADVRRIFDKQGRLLPIHEIDDDTAAAITSITVQTKNIGSRMEPEMVDVIKIKFASKMDALGLLAKHFKLVNDEGDGVNALASALADRLNAARRRAPLVEEVQDATPMRPVLLDPEAGTGGDEPFEDIFDLDTPASATAGSSGSTSVDTPASATAEAVEDDEQLF